MGGTIRLAVVAGAAGIVTLAVAAPGPQQKVTGPVATYWMSASTASGMAMGAGEAAGTVEHPHDGDALARHIQQRMRSDQFDFIEWTRCGRTAVRAQRRDNCGDRVHRYRQSLADDKRTGQPGDGGDIKRPVTAIEPGCHWQRYRH